MFLSPPRLEAASMAAWPGLGEIRLGGWVARHGAGHTRRCNSISVLTAEPRGAELLAAGEAYLAEHGAAATVRIADYAGAPRDLFEEAGYGAPFDTTVTLVSPLDRPLPAWQAEIAEGPPGVAWLDAKDRLNGESEADNAARRAILARITVPVAYGGVRGDDGAYASLAYMALDGDVASLNMVVTDPAQLGRRLAEQVCGALMAWARTRGARTACLQCKEDNLPARRLYARLGFGEPLYRYSYRVKDPAGASSG
jgi:GNAT superfamily N-acetyltransferase